MLSVLRFKKAYWLLSASMFERCGRINTSQLRGLGGLTTVLLTFAG